jgi:signal transduction histidine kinase
MEQVELVTPDLALSLPLDPYAPRAARYHIAQVDRPSPDLRDAVVLLTSELVTRAVQLCDSREATLELRAWMPHDVVRVELHAPADLLGASPTRAGERDYSLLLLDQLDRDDPLREDVEEIAKAGELAAALTQQLLVFSRRQVLEPRVLDLNLVVADVETLLRRLIREDVTLVTRLAARPVPVSADPGQLSQVIVNLVVNAEDAMPSGGLLTIETTTFDIDESYARAHALPGGGRYAVLRVSDTGIGMDEQTRSQIFEPFFTTKQRAKGTGLGLATVFGIVEQSGGHIFVSSAPGAGTTFSIYLPLVAEAPVEGRAPSNGVEALAGHESVLLVEDDDAVRSLARNVLRMRGYTVVEAADGEEALRVVRARGRPFDLVITDLVMPGLSGRELAERLSTQWPSLNVLFISGYTDDAIFRFGGLDSAHEFLQKPFTPGLLARRVREILDVSGVQP